MTKSPSADAAGGGGATHTVASHKHFRVPHTSHVPWPEQLAGQASEPSHEQSGPVQGGVQLHVPQLHVPRPEHSSAVAERQGTDEQLQNGPCQPMSHTHASHTHVPYGPH